MGIINDIKEFFEKLFDILSNIALAMQSTITYLDAVDFRQSYIFDYLGYVRYFLGDLNFVTLTSIFIIAVGVSLWSFSLKAIGFIKELLPW